MTGNFNNNFNPVNQNNINNNNQRIANDIYNKLNQNQMTGNFNNNFNPVNQNNNNNNNTYETQSNRGFYNNSINSNFTFGEKDLKDLNNNNRLNDNNLNNNNNVNNDNMNNSKKKKTFGVDSLIKNIDMDALNYYSKYENENYNNNSNNLKESNNGNLKESNNSNLKESTNRNDDNQMEQSMKSVSKLVSSSIKGNYLSTWKKKSVNGNESIQEEADNENENPDENQNENENGNEKEFEIYNSNNNFDNYKNNNYNNNDYNNYNNTLKGSQLRDSLLNKDLQMTFGEGGNILSGDSIKIKNNNDTIKRNIFAKEKKVKFLESKDEDEEENYDNIFNSNNNYDSNKYASNSQTKKGNEFLDFDNFYDAPNSNNSTLKFTLKKTNNPNNNNDILESEGNICNFYGDTKGKVISRNEIAQKVNDALLDAKDSSEEENNIDEENDKIQNQLNFFGDTLGKNLKQNRHKTKDVNARKDENMDLILSGEVLDMDVFKSGQSNRHLDLFNDNKNKDKNMVKKRNDTKESDDLQDSYCDTILKNINQYRNSHTNDFSKSNKGN